MAPYQADPEPFGASMHVNITTLTRLLECGAIYEVLGTRTGLTHKIVGGQLHAEWDLTESYGLSKQVLAAKALF